MFDLMIIMVDGCGSYGIIESKKQELLSEVLLVQLVHDQERGELRQIKSQE